MRSHLLYVLPLCVFGLACAEELSSECESGETRCNGLKLQACNDGRWNDGFDCAGSNLVCRVGASGAVCGAPTTDGGAGDAGSERCMPLEVRCAEDRYERCLTSGLGFEVLEDCAALGQGCDPTAVPHCVPKSCVRGTDPEFRCTSAGVAQICAGVYETYAPCSDEGGTCSSATGRCQTPAACPAGTQRCNGARIERCEGGQAWALERDCAYTGQTCDAALEVHCAGEARCITGELRCASDQLEICSNGAFVVTDDCPARGLGCQNNSCVPVSCQGFGVFACAGEVAQICEAGNLFQQDCGATAKVCDPYESQGCVDTCRDGILRCNGANLETCGQGRYQVLEVCPNGCRQEPNQAGCR